MGFSSGPIQTGVLQVIWHDFRALAQYLSASWAFCSQDTVSIDNLNCWLSSGNTFFNARFFYAVCG